MLSGFTTATATEPPAMVSAARPAETIFFIGFVLLALCFGGCQPPSATGVRTPCPEGKNAAQES
jgi:hypothetical protein